ncbi:Alcohol dehydrogenase 1 [Lachnellula cervina]|uniref:Alcohol dehydrogenase 1 n=1 Tax=Lachnellula cervina TaxID=1316786 RepID=A0A7D8URP0_9HELO|nr:Alcohol dehydrogenase 1 [Lachnellula cervina]
MASALPTQHRTLLLEDRKVGFHVTTRPTPQPGLGNAIVHVLAAGVLSYHREVYNGVRDYPFPTPLVGGSSAVGRVAAVGPDATALKPGQLVWIDCVIHGRDDPDALFLTAIHEGYTEGSKKLIRDVWRDGTFAEYAKLPLENCIALDETRLCGSLGYSIQDLAYTCCLLVPYGGLRDINLEPGETVVVCPATGGFGGAGVLVAIAMGARVIAMGRNEKELARLKEYVLKGSPNASIETAKMTGEEMKDAATLKDFGTIDAVLDFTPPQASKSAHVRSAVWALRRGGRVSLMGFNDNPCAPIVTGRNIMLKGKLMYERPDMVQFVKLLERGLFPQGKDLVDTKAFKLEDWDECFDAGAKHTGIGRHVILENKLDPVEEPPT